MKGHIEPGVALLRRGVELRAQVRLVATERGEVEQLVLQRKTLCLRLSLVQPRRARCADVASNEPGENPVLPSS